MLKLEELCKSNVSVNWWIWEAIDSFYSPEMVFLMQLIKDRLKIMKNSCELFLAQKNKAQFSKKSLIPT